MEGIQLPSQLISAVFWQDDNVPVGETRSTIARELRRSDAGKGHYSSTGSVDGRSARRLVDDATEAVDVVLDVEDEAEQFVVAEARAGIILYEVNCYIA